MSPLRLRHLFLAVAFLLLGIPRSGLPGQASSCGQDSTPSIRVRAEDFFSITRAEAAKVTPLLDRIAAVFRRASANSKGLVIEEYRSYGAGSEPRRSDLVFRIAELQCNRGRPTAKHTGLYVFYITFAVNTLTPMLIETLAAKDPGHYFNFLDSLAAPGDAAVHTRSATANRSRGRVENWLLTRDGTPPWQAATRAEILEWNVESQTRYLGVLTGVNQELADLLGMRMDSLEQRRSDSPLTGAQRSQAYSVLVNAAVQFEKTSPLAAPIAAARKVSEAFVARRQALPPSEAVKSAYLRSGLLPVLPDTQTAFADPPGVGSFDSSALLIRPGFLAPNAARSARSIIVQLRQGPSTPLEAAFAASFVDRLDFAALRSMLRQ